MFKHIIYIALAVIFLLTYFRYFEYKSLYIPMREIEIDPGMAGIYYEDVSFVTDDGVKLNAWLVPARNTRYTALFCHGNGGNLSHRIDKIIFLNSIGLDVFIFDYRGYGGSGGRPSEQGLYRDALAAYNYLVTEEKIPPEKIILYGESLGGAVAIDLAAKKRPAALITESTFTSASATARTVYPFLPTFLISAKYDALSKIKNVEIPKLIIHSKNDEIIPFAHSVKLMESAKEPKTHLVLRGTHNSCYAESKDLYLSGISEFLQRL